MFQDFDVLACFVYLAGDRSKQYMIEFPKVSPQDSDIEREYEGYDGWFNNRGKHDLGAVGKYFQLNIFMFTSRSNSRHHKKCNLYRVLG